MGSGDWFKTIVCRKKGKKDKSKQLKALPASEKSDGSKCENHSEKETADFVNGVSSGTNRKTCILSEDTAAIRIQTAFRAFLARKYLRRQKGAVKLQKLIQAESVKKQSTSTLSHLHSWGRIQAQIKERRLCMVVEGRLKQKKLENQLMLEAKLHDLEVEWCDGSDSMEEILARIHQREEAAVKRERALAYAFTHQWRANSNQNQGVNASELGKANWGWSWKERWVAARPWESRVESQTTCPKKGQSKQTSKAGNNTNPLSSQKSLPIKSNSSNCKGGVKGRRLSFPVTEASVGEPNTKIQDSNARKELIFS